MFGCTTLKPPPAIVVLPTAKNVPESKHVAVTALEMGTKTVYPFVPWTESRKYGLFVKLQNVSNEKVKAKVRITPPLSSLKPCNFEVALSPGEEGGGICMQSAPVPDEDYALRVTAYDAKGDLIDELSITARFSEKDVSAFVGAAEGK